MKRSPPSVPSPSRDRDRPAESPANRFKRHLELIRELEAHPDNRSGADKSWVEAAMRDYQDHYRKATRD